MIRDPAGLLTRIQELEPLCSDLGIRRAVEKGDPFKVYRAIWWARRSGKLVAHRRTLDILLKSRRAFAKPLKGKLFLGTFNGFGATLLGSAEQEPDGTRIATHHVVGLFVIPLFPLGAYVVAGGERKGLSTSWNIFARVPLGAFTWIWSRAAALAVIAAVAWAGASAFWASRHHDLTIVNGLDVPVHAKIGDASRDLMPGGVVTLSVPVGTLRATAATRAGVELESFDLPVSAGGRTALVWNVAGAAPVYEEIVEYFAKKPDASHQGPKPTLHCGDRVIRAAAVDYAFKAPPPKVSMAKGAARETRRHLDLATGLDEPPAAWCANMLLSSSRDADALRLLEARYAAAGWKPDDALFVLHLATAVSAADGERVARKVHAALPDDMLLHRAYQDALEAAGKGSELLAEYRQRAEAAPDSGTAQYLHLRLLEGAEQRDRAEAALARFPKDPDLLRLVTILRSEAGDFAGTAATYHALRAASPEQASQVLYEVTASFVSLGRRADARSEIASLFDALPPPRRYEAAALYARVAALDGARAGAPDVLVKRLEEKGPDPLLRARAGLPVPAAKADVDPPLALALYALAGKDPGAALEKLKALPPAVGLQLDGSLWSLLFCEAARIGSPVENMLRAYARARPRHLELLRRYVRGEPGVTLPGISLEVRAAARFVRSRNGSLPAAERAALVATARTEDPFATYVTEAIARWPAGTR